MADEFNTGTNLWDSSRAAGSSSSSSGLNNSLGSYGWPNEMADNFKAAGATRSSMDSVSSSTSVQAMDLQIMGLGLSSQAMDWNQALLRGEKSSEGSFRSMFQDHNYHHHHQQQEEKSGIGSSQVHWRDKMFSLDQQSQFSPHGSSSDSTVLPASFQMDSAALYGSPSTILQGLLGSDQNQAQQQQSSINYQYGVMNTNEQVLPNSWSKIPQFLRNSPPKQQQQPNQLHGQLHFSNNAPFWNPSAGAASMADHHVRPGLQTQFQTGDFEEKPKNISEVRDTSTMVKKSGNEPASNKRTRNENPSTMPAFKVRKEKMGDRITALQQLVSPFGKTDTASVLSEAIEYIKFLHEQVSVLSTPYMKNDQAAIQHQQNPENSKDPEEPKQDLRSRGLCLVPVSSTFPFTHDSPVDFWTPTFGGTFR